MTLTSLRTYTNAEFDTIVNHYNELFGNDFFQALPYLLKHNTDDETYCPTLLASNPNTFLYSELQQEIESIHWDELPSLPLDSIKQKLGDATLAIGLTPWTDYTLQQRTGDEKGTVLVVGQDWYPLRESLRSPLQIQSPADEPKKEYHDAFSLISDKGYLPVFINLVPGLRDTDDKTGNFSKYHNMDYLAAVIEALNPTVVVTWGRDVYNSIHDTYGPFDASYDIGQGEQAITEKKLTFNWLPLFHPSHSGWHRDENKQQMEHLTRLLE